MQPNQVNQGTKRPNPAYFDDETKLENVNSNIKRQIPPHYSTTSISNNNGFDLLSPTLYPSSLSGSLLPHNGLNALEQQQDEHKKREFSLEERLKPLIPLCKDCGVNTNVIEDERVGSYICTKCGLECGRIIIESAEWRNFGDSGDASRVVAEDANFGLEHAIRSDTGLKTKQQQIIARSTQHLDSLRNILQFPDHLFTESRNFVQQYVSAPQDIIKGNIKADLLAGVALFLAAKYSKIPISQDRVISTLQLTTSHFNKYLKRMESVRHWVKQKNNQEIVLLDPIQEVINHMMIYGKRFSLSKQSLDVGACIIRTFCESKQQYVATNSNVIAGGVIYFLTSLLDMTINPHELARICEASFENIKKRSLEIYTEREKLVPDGFVETADLEQMNPPN